MKAPASTYSSFDGRIARWGCGCVFDRGEGDRRMMRWDACHLHAQAEAMRDLLRDLVRIADAKLLSEKAKVVSDARALLRAVEGTVTP